jgi:hypothetical protein
VDRAFIADNFSSSREYEAFVIDYLQTRTLPTEVSDYLESL